MKPRVSFASSSVESLSRQVGLGLSTIFLWLTASARWVFLGPHHFLRKNIKRVWCHGCRTASPSLTQMATWQGTSTAGCAQTLGWISAHCADIKLSCLLITPLTTFWGSPSPAVLLAVPLPMLTGPGIMGLDKYRTCCKRSWSCHLL